jgi:hypothetical protein
MPRSQYLAPPPFANKDRISFAEPEVTGCGTGCSHTVQELRHKIMHGRQIANPY